MMANPISRRKGSNGCIMDNVSKRNAIRDESASQKWTLPEFLRKAKWIQSQSITFASAVPNQARTPSTTAQV
jgi:hypothetical protein